MIDLATGLREAGIATALAQRLADYGAAVLEANRHTNLTGAKNAQALLPHLLDSLTLAPFVRDRLIDVGSGAGLPAIPLALATGLEITLVEATLKKARFLGEALQRFGLRGEVIPARAEVAAREGRLRDRFASGTVRAVAGGNASAELLLPFIAPGGLALLQRAKITDVQRDALADTALVLAAELEHVLSVDGDRCIVMLRKTGPTPKRFPRRTGIPAKRPLCS
ncbi:MAG TPA: 16S rRNA (guanine(527)-N(7))-methyltransferase RsmG [Candidatus Tyrphobacter sp.]